ncbi:MAG: MMPL family transporter [Solirubrobacteraceae bacterium]
MRVFDWLAHLAAHRRKLVLGVAGGVILAGLALTPVFQSNLRGVGYDTPGTDSFRVAQLISRTTGYTERDALVVYSDRYRSSSSVFQRAYAHAVAAIHHVDAKLLVLGPGAPGGGAIAPDRFVETATVGLTGDAAHRQDLGNQLQTALASATPRGVHAGITGDSPLTADLIHIEETDMTQAEAVGLPIAAIILLLAFGSAVAAGLPLMLGVSGLFVSFGVIAGFMLLRSFNAFVESLMAMIGLAIGIDYALLLVRRFREERRKEGTPEEAMARTLRTAGRTVMFSGAILSASLVPLAITNLPFFGDTAFAVIAVVIIEVLLLLTLLPAVLLALGDRLDKGRVPARFRGGAGVAAEQTRWYRWTKGVMRRPWPILAGGVIVLVAAGAPTLGLKTGIDLNARAMHGSPSVKPLDALQRHFPAAAALGPIEVVVQSSSDLQAATARAVAVLRSERNLAVVEQLQLTPSTSLLVANPLLHVDSAAAAALVGTLRAQLPPAVGSNATAQLGGVTAETADYSQRTNQITPWVIGFALLLAFSLLLWLFRSPLLALKAIVLNLLTIGAAIGLCVLVFQDGHGQSLLGFTSPGYLQSWMPLTLFVVLFGLSMDYEVFIVSRIREEWERSGDNTEAVARGLERTGSVVTSAATIMVAIFGSFLLVVIPEMKQMGFGLAVSVLIDATIVRAMLVPAFMRIAGRWNWWMPGTLDRLLPRLEH